MALFSRRTLQQLVWQNIPVMSEGLAADMDARVNGKNVDQRLAAEWELAIVNALTKLGKVGYAEASKGSAVPDVRFVASSGEEFLADITAVSDTGYHESNPFDYLQNELVRRVQKQGLDANHFSLKVDGNSRKLYLGGPKARLALPRVSDFATVIFNKDFARFIADIISNPSQVRAFSARSGEEVSLSITYNPNQPFFTGNHLAYDVVFSLENNPIYNRLKRKAEQLRRSGYSGIKGIILCDAGCAVMRAKSRAGFHYSAKEIVAHFLRRNKSISFIQLLTVDDDKGHHSDTHHFRVVEQTYLNSPHSVPESLMLALQAVPSVIARPQNKPCNARQEGKRRGSFYGGLKLSANTLRISARALLDLLAGRLSRETFLRDHGLLDSPSKNMFESALKEGRLLCDVRFEHCPNSDDDWISFSFSNAPDPAISPISFHKQHAR